MPARILVIDDSPMLLELTVKALQLAGMETLGAADLSQLDERLKTGPFDLVLVDVNMPEMFGDDVVEFLRTQRQIRSKMLLHSDIPVDELEQKAKASGAHGFISKSEGVEAMVAQVVELVGHKPPAAASSTVPATASAPARKRRVLIVDDSEMTTKLLEAELLSKGFDVSTADTADKATKIILKKQTRPDLVLLDVRMPNVNGEQFCRFIKSNALFKGIKVLLCSGENPEELQRICRDAGADGYIPKDAILGNLLTKELG
jgi:CheY-like chemotaxis protein